MSDVLPPIDELLAEFDSGKIPRSQTWHTLITGLYFNFDSVNEIENWYKTVQELTSVNQDLANKIQQNHDQIEIWYGEVDTWQQQVASHTQQAANSASAAQASETAAASSASTASTAAETATQQASAAEASATKARASETASASSASQSESSATSAGSSASNALNSANKAKASETAAQQAASTAQMSEHNSEESASQAKASETAAASSASTATQQADRSESEADRSEAAAEKINREGIPIGSIVPYYGSSAPMGWLGLTKGATISKADYPALFTHLTDQRKAPKFSERQFADYQDGVNWVKGMTLNSTHENTFHKGKMAITGIGVAIPGGTSVIKDASYIWYPGKTCVIRIDESNAVDHNTAIWSVVVGDAVTAINEYQFPNKWNIYHSLTDIPLPNDECFLPDAGNNFIKGYEPSETRGMGTFEQDAIRNITGSTIVTNDTGALDRGFYKTRFTGAFGEFTAKSSGQVSSGANAHTGVGINFDTSRIVPTGPENVPKNLNCLWIIKAYDAVNDPEQLQAKAVIDQVNSNSSDLLAVNGAVSRLDDSIGYALLDFGVVNTRGRYVQASPFGIAPVKVQIEMFNDGSKGGEVGWGQVQYSQCWGESDVYGLLAGLLNGNIVLCSGIKGLTHTSYNSLDPFNLPSVAITSAPCRVHVWRVKG